MVLLLKNKENLNCYIVIVERMEVYAVFKKKLSY